DLDGDHLEDARRPPQQRSALLQFMAARRRFSAAGAGQAAGAGYAEAGGLSDGDDRHQAAARLEGGAQGAAQHRARPDGDVSFEGGLGSSVDGDSPAVIASEAKQSTFLAAETKLDCFVASLLAMTG